MKATRLISSATLTAMLLLLGQQAFASIVPNKSGIHTLILVDDWATIDTHSVFFESLRKDGH